MYRIASASGITTAANEEIMLICRNVTKFKNNDSDKFPVALRKINFFADQATSIYVNTSDLEIADGIDETILKESFAGSGEFVVATNIQDVLISSLKIKDIGVTWQITFLY
jgi:hypothetical protein